MTANSVPRPPDVATTHEMIIVITRTPPKASTMVSHLPSLPVLSPFALIHVVRTMASAVITKIPDDDPKGVSLIGSSLRQNEAFRIPLTSGLVMMLSGQKP